MVKRFNGEYEFLSNFYPSVIVEDKIEYPTVEHYFQAMKSLDRNERLRISSAPTPEIAKKLGRKVTLREDWETIKNEVMFNGVFKKFSEHEDLKIKLIETGDEELVEGNTWKDKYWGVYNGVGENHLGKTLMKVRDILKGE